LRRLLFVVTTRENMGDLALCEEWIGDLGREEFRFAFVLAPELTRFIDPADAQFWFFPEHDVGDTIAEAAKQFRPDAVVLATNSFWTIPGQRGAVFGRYPEQLFRLGVPILSFDPFETGFRATVVPVNITIEFPAVPPHVWSLRFVSRDSAAPNARHFSTRGLVARARDLPRADVLRAQGADPRKRTVVFPVSRNRYAAICESFPEYYEHLARIFAHPAVREAQFVVVSPEAISDLDRLPNVVHVEHLPFNDFMRLVGASDLYLTDSLISSMISGLQLGVPVLLLVATLASASRARGTFLERGFFPYKVFPYGFTEICDALAERFELRGCVREAEVLDVDACAAEVARLLFDTPERHTVLASCAAWNSARAALPSPRQAFEDILSAASPLTATAR
jgi:hypothetical protein